MKILTMTASFGKLENRTLTLQPGLNVIEAPNEWGKSTWCAFITAMLYGIDTRAHSTKTALADKERYAPWSGAPMSGRMDIDWDGRRITLERSSKGRSVFGYFRAYETDTGLEVPELTGTNCGQVLLGVEKNVFLRAGFLRLSDLPITQDEALRRRLNAIVTTGDESGTADALGQTLKDLKNRCRANRSTGLLPQAEEKRKDLQDKLWELERLGSQAEQYTRRLQQLQQWHRELENHRIALDYADNCNYAQTLADAQAAADSAAAAEASLRKECQNLPAMEEAQRQLLQLRQLRQQWDCLHMDSQLLPQEPEKPEVPPCFQGLTPEEALQQARRDQKSYAAANGKRPFPWHWILLILAGIPALLIPHWAGIALAAVLASAGAILFAASLSKGSKEKTTAAALLRRYQPLLPQQWESAALSYGQAMESFNAAKEKHARSRQQLEQQSRTLREAIAAAADGKSLAEAESHCADTLHRWQALASAAREHRRALEYLQTLQQAQRQSPAPAFPDRLTHSRQETARLLSDCESDLRQLQKELDQTLGRREALGEEAALRRDLDAVAKRIAALEETYAALELAQNTLSAATAQLQRRFAPQIVSRAQTLFSQLTQGRYRRLTLGEDLSANTAAGDETTLRSVLWRSDGTVDQLYLSLRLAMAEALSPTAPFILDDALVRFDDTRLAHAMSVLKEEAQTKQVILFTCQNRETRIKQKEEIQ